MMMINLNNKLESVELMIKGKNNILLTLLTQIYILRRQKDFRISIVSWS